MIQLPQSKSIETTKGNPKVVGNEAHSNLKGSKLKSKENSEMNEFANELDAKLNSGEANLKPVEVSIEQLMKLPSSLVQPNGESEMLSPKVFDPGMTKEVEKLTAPVTSDLTGKLTTKSSGESELAKISPQGLNGEVSEESEKSNLDQLLVAPIETSLNPFSSSVKSVDTSSISQTDASLPIISSKAEQVLLKTPQIESDIISRQLSQTEKLATKGDGLESVLVKNPLATSVIAAPLVSDAWSSNGRHPAIELTSSEVDPQLLSNEDFVSQKNIFSKKIVSNPYGLKSLPVEQKNLIHDSVTSEVQTLKDLKSSEGSSVNSQQFILGMQAEKSIPQNLETQASVKVFDMNKIKSSNTNEIMNQITDYVIQAKAAKEPTVNMRVNHAELGTIDINVIKVGINQEAIVVNIGTHSVDGKNFFQQNTKDLFTHLSSAGLNVSDLKVETPQQTAKNDFDFGSQSGKSQQQGNEKQFGSEQNQRRHESERRQDLWKLLNKEAA